MGAMSNASDRYDPRLSGNARPVLNRDREEIRVHSPDGERLLAFLARRGIRGAMRADSSSDVISLIGEPDMGRVAAAIADWADKH